jgi:hypothetical protein
MKMAKKHKIRIKIWEMRKNIEEFWVHIFQTCGGHTKTRP